MNKHITSPATLLFRNIPQVVTIFEKLIPEMNVTNSPIKILVYGCSSGEEPLSVSAVSELYDFDITIDAFDNSRSVLDMRDDSKTIHLDWHHGERLEYIKKLLSEFFVESDNKYSPIETIRKKIKFGFGDVFDPEFMQEIKDVHIIMIQNMFVHYIADDVRLMLKNIIPQLAVGGFLICGAYSKARYEALSDFPELVPIDYNIEEIHNAWVLRKHYYDPKKGDDNIIGLEPLNKDHKDWKLRYSSIFKHIPRGSA